MVLTGSIYPQGRYVPAQQAYAPPLCDVVELRTRGEAPCGVVREVMAREATAIDSRIRELQELRAELKRLQAKAAEITDVWPEGPCVCHLVETEAETSTNEQRLERLNLPGFHAVSIV